MKDFIRIYKKPDRKNLVAIITFPDGTKSKPYNTHKTVEHEAYQVALNWYYYGLPDKNNKTKNIKVVEAVEACKKLSNNEMSILCDELKKNGNLKAYILPNTQQAITLKDYLTNFWNYEKSDYIKAKLNKGKSIGRLQCSKQAGNVKNYWLPYFGDTITIGELTQKTLKQFTEKHIGNLDKSFGTKNDICYAGITALRYAYENELISDDITKYFKKFVGKNKKRAILTLEIAISLFLPENKKLWKNESSRLANMLSMFTGMRQGEIKALRFQDLGKNIIYVNHSYNRKDGLKSTKNGENRTVYVIDAIQQEILKQASKNPYNAGLSSFIFFASMSNKPMDAKPWIDDLRDVLQKLGIADASIYTFHAWRHFYSTYMKDRISQKILQTQTGHKTLQMLEHYQNHETETNKATILKIQEKLFSEIK